MSRPTLRPYQRRAIDLVYDWFRQHQTGHPCLQLPTGSGKSHIVAEFCFESVTTWSETRILMLSHVKEILQQNTEKMRQHWPAAPLGIYSAGLGSRRLEQITFAGIQSVYKRSKEIGHVDIVLVDECHLMNNNRVGMYRRLLGELEGISPALRVIGLTATPYRLGQGLLTEGEDALFSDIIEPVSIQELVDAGFLVPLRSKSTAKTIDASGVKKRAGDYIEADLAAVAMLHTEEALAEATRRAADRQSWIVFCVGVDHAYQAANILNGLGISAETIVGTTPKADRTELIERYKSGDVRVLTNANVLTTGFDAPETDCLVMLRPTLSPGLYLQMAGRGMRPADGKVDCLFLDFAGLVRAHGPVTMVEPPKAKEKGDGQAPIKECPDCKEMVHASVRECPDCGHVFEQKTRLFRLHEDDAMSIDAQEMVVSSWRWFRHISRQSGKEMLKVIYYPENVLGSPVTEYLCIMHEGYAGQKAMKILAGIIQGTGAWDYPEDGDLNRCAEHMEYYHPPARIRYQREGKFFRITERIWR